MARPRINPDRPLSNAERLARRYDRFRCYREALRAIVAARSITEARKLALHALDAREQREPAE